ncbi:MAG: Lipoprotein signal peptidase [Phycisphaerae bacterium]|nr:Lipoprotein signal peptidase [Phycisphaerae bacterium]
MVLIGLFLDLFSKYLAFSMLSMNRPYPLSSGLLSFRLSLNPGALWGLGAFQTEIFIFASVAAFFFVLYVFARSDAGQHWFHLALGMVLSGALGNLHDRLFNNGFVRDFISIDIRILGRAIWPWIFNIADVLLVCGVAILVIQMWSLPNGPEKKADPQAPPTTSTN